MNPPLSDKMRTAMAETLAAYDNLIAHADDVGVVQKWLYYGSYKKCRLCLATDYDVDSEFPKCPQCPCGPKLWGCADDDSLGSKTTFRDLIYAIKRSTGPYHDVDLLRAAAVARRACLQARFDEYERGQQ